MVEKITNRYNNLTGKEWLQHSFSIWRDIRKSDEEKSLNHPAIFPKQVCSRIIDIFTKKDDLVLDPFMGTGSTIITAYQKQRKSIGIELSKSFIEITQNRLSKIKGEFSFETLYEPILYNQDARNIIDVVNLNSVDLCLTSPPYWDILNMKRTADLKKSRYYSKDDKDLGNIDNYKAFLLELSKVFSLVYKLVKLNRHCVVILMDIRKKNIFYPFHSDFADIMKNIGFSFEDLIIWDRQHEYNNMKPLGYPYVFRVNKVHEYILIFKKIHI